MKKLFLIFILFVTVLSYAQNKPNIILLMADDLGYGDVGFNGNTIIKTPNMDALASKGLKFTNFYSGGAVCSPTRGTCLTGRHFHRYGIFSANLGHLPTKEITIQQLLKQNGYTTGHFGKWHIGCLDSTYSPKPGRRPDVNYAPPWEHNYDVSMVTESSVATWADAVSTTVPYYFNAEIETENVLGDDSRILMDRVVPFIENAVASKQPFLSTIWFHAPHEPVVAGPDYRAMYSEYAEGEQHYYGCITAMDDQIGRLYEKLEELEIEDNTIIFFCSDNGPEGQEQTEDRPGSTGGLRGRKRSMYCGGTGVPAFVIWPGKTDTSTTTGYISSTLDYLPTLIDALEIDMPDNRPIDGISLLPMLNGESYERPRPLPFMNNKGKAAWIAGDLKFITKNNGTIKEVYNLRTDRFETTNIISQHPEVVAEVQQYIYAWNFSCKRSHAGGDYEELWTPVDPWDGLTVTENIAFLTVDETFDFEVGDEFQYIEDSAKSNLLFKKYIVLEKSESNGVRTYKYLCSEFSIDNLSTPINEYSVSKSFNNLSSYVIDMLPEYNYNTLNDAWGNTEGFNFDTIYQSSHVVCDAIFNGFACTFGEENPELHNYEYSKGIGLTYSKTSTDIDNNKYVTKTLIAYKKSNIQCSEGLIINNGSSLYAKSQVKNSDIQVYPNPTSEFIHIKGLGSSYNYTIINNNGRIIYRGFNNKDHQSIDISGLTQGMYIVLISEDSKNITAKRIIVE